MSLLSASSSCSAGEHNRNRCRSITCNLQHHEQATYLKHPTQMATANLAAVANSNMISSIYLREITESPTLPTASKAPPTPQL
eukprot:scaffold33076_cov160-Skeletonema_menzelii.AAC.2